MTQGQRQSLVTYRVYSARCVSYWGEDAPEEYDWGRWGGYSTIPSGPVHQHVRMLIDRGHTPRSIAAAAGVSQRMVADLAARCGRNMFRENAERILAVTVDEPPAPVPHPVPSVRLSPFVDELRSRGWSLRQINAASGCANVWKSAYGSKFVRWQTWRRITTLYALLARRGEVDASLLEGVRDA